MAELDKTYRTLIERSEFQEFEGFTRVVSRQICDGSSTRTLDTISTAMSEWCDDADRPGLYFHTRVGGSELRRVPVGVVISTADIVHYIDYCFWFSDVDTAFEFKIRWC